MKEKSKSLFKYIMTFIITISAFMLLLTAASSIPSRYIYENVKKSSEILLNEGNRKIIYIPYRCGNMQFDNYTDALMINTAYSIDTTKPLFSAFIARKNYIPNVTTEVYQDQPGELRSSSKYKYHNEVGELNDLVNNEKTESFEYARYWHGYLILLRPLLVVFNLAQIRIILTCVLIILCIIFTILLYKKTNIVNVIIFSTGLLGVEYFYLGFSLQGIFVFLIMMIASIILLCKYDKNKNYFTFFFVIGMLTNFFDFLTVPIVTYAIPTIILFILMHKEENSIKIETTLKMILIYGIAWGTGYGLTWASKWILTDLIFKRNMLFTALQQVAYRSNGTANFNVLDVINENVNYMRISIFISTFFTILIILIKMWIDDKKITFSSNNIKNTWHKIFIYFIIGIIPIIWYMLLQNHSYYHAFFTYRNLLISNICVNLCIEEVFMFLTNEKEEENERKN